MRKFVMWMVVLGGLNAGLWSEELANPTRLEVTRGGRGDQFTVRIESGPAGTTNLRIGAERVSGGPGWDADSPAYSYTAAASGTKSFGTATGRIKENAELGDYRITVYLDKGNFPAAGILTVRPSGGNDIQLDEFLPSNTYEWEDVWAGAPNSEEGIATRTVSLTLRGRGFSVQSTDNVIRINGAPAQIVWDGCSVSRSAGSKSKPVEFKTHGEVVSPQEIRLCWVPIPADGQMLFTAGFGDTPGKSRPFRVFSMNKTQVAWRAIIIAFAMALVPLFLLSFAKGAYQIGGADYKLRMLFLDPETDTYSLSKLQFYMWTVASIFGYSYLFLSRVIVQALTWPDVPAGLPGIIAVAGGTAVGAQVVSAMKGSKGAGEQRPNFADFITSGGVVAADRLQMLLWTIIGVGAFFMSVLSQGPGTMTDLPAVPERLLYLMGISSAGYLGGKMARKAGPVINEISVTPAESDAGIAGAAIPTVNLPDLVRTVVQAQDQLNSLPPVVNANARATVDALSGAIRAAGAAHTVSELNQMMADLAVLRGKAEQGARDSAADFEAGKATQAEAQTAQQVAACLQDFSADVIQAISRAAAAPMEAENRPILIGRTIELRGTNMSAESVLEIDHADLAFRMLFNKDGQNTPEIVVREDAIPTFARVLRLTLDPARMGSSDLAQFQTWFGANGIRTFTLTNPDGQKAELTFSLPPGEMQKQGNFS